MWFLLLIFAFTSANLVDNDEDNIAMESQATQYRAKYYRPEVHQPAESYYSQDYETSEYYPRAAASAKRPKKYHESKKEKENVYINVNKNNYASRAREPRDEAPWRPLVYQNDEENRQSSGNYHYQESTVKPQKHYYESSKQPKKYQESNSEQHSYLQRYKQTQQPTASNHHEKPQENYQIDLNDPNQRLQTPFAYLQRHEENIHGGKMLGYTSLVEHFADEEMNDEEMKTALKEGSLDDIKKIVPKSGAVFEIYSDEESVNTQHAPKNQAINNNVDQNDVSSSATTYSYAKANNWANYKNSNQQSVAATTKTWPVEKKKQVKAPRTREPTQQYSNDQYEESNSRITFRNQKSRTAIKTSEYPQSHQYTKPSYDYPTNSPVVEETRVYPQIEAASKQNYRPIHSVLSNQNVYFGQQQNDDYRLPQKSALQSQVDPISQENANNYYISNIRGYSNYSHNLPSHSSDSTSETEINRPGSNLRTVIVYSTTPKPPESQKHYEQYKHPNHLIQNNKPESFDHQKALQSSFSFNSGNILGNHNPVSQESSNTEGSRSPIQFASENENTQKQTSQAGPKHIQKYVQKYAESLFKNMYKTKEEQNDEESKRFRYQLELAPRPEALVSLKQPPKFDMEAPMMTEEEFQLKFGHLPLVVSTPRSPYYASTISSPTQDVFDVKIVRPHAEALTQFWTQPAKETIKFNKYPTTNDINQGKPKKPQILSHPPVKHPNSYKHSDISEDSSNTVAKYTKGQIERPSLSGWKNGKIYLTKEFDGKFSDLYIKSSDKENIQHPGFSSHARPGRPQNHKNIILASNHAPHVQEKLPVKFLKYDINLSPSFRFQKRGDEEAKNISIVSENASKSSNHEKKNFKTQGVVLTGTNDRDSNQFSVSASYQIDRNDQKGKQ